MTSGRIAILGSGAWGTTLGKVLVEAGNEVVIWGAKPELCKNINDNNCLPARLEGILLPEALHATTDIENALNASGRKVCLVIVAISAQKARGVLTNLLPDFVRVFGENREKWPAFLSLMKGLEAQTDMLMSQMIADVLQLPPNLIAALAGPNLAKEVASQMPSSATIASSSLQTAQFISGLFNRSAYFETEVSADIRGVQMMSCLKNVYALLCGYRAGKGYGASTAGALITRAIAECQSLLHAIDADSRSALSYAGVGDMLATCTSHLSRNYSFGFRIGEGVASEKAASQSSGVVEGVATIAPILKLSKSTGVQMPLVEEAAQIFGV
jgi:glycerol-3-phosphate dehydrogenase (NAD(P)+)